MSFYNMLFGMNAQADTPEDLRKAIRHGAIEAKYRVGGDVSREDERNG